MATKANKILAAEIEIEEAGWRDSCRSKRNRPLCFPRRYEKIWTLPKQIMDEIRDKDLWSPFGVKLGHAGAGGVVGRDSGYCVITLPAA
jgi:hypothetical protein